MSRHHLTDTELFELQYDVAVDGSQEHLAGCPTCIARQRALSELLDDVTVAAAADADQHFSADALAHQHARIVSRVAFESRSAKVISFPAAAQAPAPAVRRARPRWMAGAVAAGVILGLVGEHVTQRITRATFEARTFRPPVTAAAAPAGVVRAISTSSDDEFFGQVERAFGSSGPATLRPLDALTPRAWDVRE
jgi:hypothetical protein